LKQHTFSQNLQSEERSEYPKVDPITSGMTEYAFVLRCVRPNPKLCPVGPVRSRILHGINWEQVIRIATYNNVTPLFLHNIKMIAGDVLPTKIKTHIEQYFQVNHSHNQIQLQELGHLTKILKNNKIRTIILKGRPLGSEAYGDTLVRRSTDFDVLIPADKFPEAENLLLAEGYNPYQKVQNLKGLKKQINLWFSKQYPFQKYKGLFNLDLHIAVMPPGYHYPVNFDQLWERSKSISMNGIEIRALEPEELLILLSYHGVKNQWHNLKYVCDIAALLESHPDLKWETILVRARRNRCQRFVLIGLALANSLLDASLPSQIEQQIQNDEMVKKVVSTCMKILRLRHTRRTFSYKERVWFHLATREDYREKVRYVLMSLMVNIWSSLFKRNPVEN